MKLIVLFLKYFSEVKESFIMAVESTCLLIAGVLMLITIIILIIGTVIVSFCSRDEEIDYHMIPQGDWHPEHLDYDSIIDLLQSIQKSKKFQGLQDFLAQGKHLVHLNDRWEETEWSVFSLHLIQRKEKPNENIAIWRRNSLLLRALLFHGFTPETS